MKVGIPCVLCAGFLISTGLLTAQAQKPDFTGTWKLNREKSDLRGPTFRRPPGGDWGGGPGGMGGMGGGGGMGGPGMGGPGMGGPGMDGPGGWGGPGPAPGARGGDPQTMGVAETLEILHEEPQLTVRFPMQFGEEEQIFEFRHTTDGRKSRNTVPGGGVVKAQSKWKKDRLTTTSTAEGPMGTMQVTETRSLSEDGRMMTVEHTMRSTFMDWRRKLVYEREPSASTNP